MDSHGFPLPKGAIARLGDLRFAQPGHIVALAVSPNGKQIATASTAEIYLSSTKSGRITREMPAPNWVKHLVFSKSGQFLASAEDNGDVAVWNANTGKLVWKARWRKADLVKQITGMRFIEGDELIAVCAYWSRTRGDRYRDWRVVLTDLKTGRHMRVWNAKTLKKKPPEKNTIVAAALSPSGQKMAWLTAANRRKKNRQDTLLLYDTKSGRFLNQARVSGFADQIHVLDEGQSVLLQVDAMRNRSEAANNAVASMRSGRERFRFPTRMEVMIGRPFGMPIESDLMALSPDRKSFYVQDEVGMTRYDLTTGNSLQKWNHGFTALAFAFDGKMAVAADRARWQLCDLQLKKRRPPIRFSDAPSIQFLASSRLAVGGRWGGPLQIWDRELSKPVQGLKLHSAPLTSRSPCGFDRFQKRVVYHKDRRLVVRDLVIDRQLCRLAGVRMDDEQSVWGVFPSLSADGKRVLVYSTENKQHWARWFDSSNGRELGRYLIPATELFPDQTYPLEWYSEDGSVFGYTTRDSRLALVDCKQRKVCRVIGTSVRLPANLSKDERHWPAWNFDSAAHGRLVLAKRWRETTDGVWTFAVFDRQSGRRLRLFQMKSKDENKGDYVYPTLSPDGCFMATRIYHKNEIAIFETATGRRRGKIVAPNTVEDLSISPDCKRLATSGEDSAVLIWDINRPLGGSPKITPPKTPVEREKLWQMLGNPDPAAAEQAIWTLVRSPGKALSFLRGRLKPVQDLRPLLNGLIEKLDSKKFSERQAATRKLIELGEIAVPALRAAAKKMSLEQHLRVEKILARTEDPARLPDHLAEIRAIEALERIGNEEAVNILRAVAGGTDDSPITWEARMALGRLGREH